ncbi:MAG: MBL fold metallo-hydrolase [Promethearchaeota archaeon]
MEGYQIENLKIINVTEDVLLAHQIKTPFHFSCCDGLIILPKKGRNSKTIILDLNIEPPLVNQINKLFGPISDYICTHTHMDHMAHVHAYEELGVKIHAPYPESSCLLDIENFYENFGFNEVLEFSHIEQFGQLNGYQECNDVNTYNPGNSLIFEKLEVETLPFSGHSKAHVGFLLPNERIIHLSCLGFDQSEPGKDGFGPWYGFRECSIEQYLKDIDYAEKTYVEWADYLTSSHSYIVNSPDLTPFIYMKVKIAQNQEKVDNELKQLNMEHNDMLIKKLLDRDLFFPKKKMKGSLLEIYTHWEYWILKHHINRSRFYQ